jgi:hypothetical protein
MIRKLKDTENGRCVLLVLAAAAAVVLNSAVLSPLLIVFSSDVAYASSILPPALTVLTTALELLTLALTAAAVCCSAYADFAAPRMSGLVFAAAGCLLALRGALDIVMTGAVNSFGSLDLSDFLWTLLTAVLDLAILAAAFLVSRRVSREHYADCAEFAKQYRRATGDEFDERTRVFPFPSFMSVANPVQAGLLTAAAVNTFLKVVARVIFDISAGAPADAAETASIVFAYLWELLSGLLVYTAACLACRPVLKNNSRNTAE